MIVKIKWNWGVSEIKSFNSRSEANVFLDKNDMYINKCILNFNQLENFDFKKVKDPCDYTDYEMDMYL